MDHGELARRKGDRFSVERHLVRRRVDDQIAYLNDGIGAARSSSKQRANPRRKFFKVEWLHQIVVGSGIETFDTVGNRVARGQNQHWNGVAAPAQRGQDFETALPREAQV